MPEPGPGEVRVRVKAAGVNFPDLLMSQGKYQMKPPLPFIPGGECAGVISEVGPGVKGFKAGDRVIAATMLSAFAEKAAAHVSAIAPMPASMPF